MDELISDIKEEEKIKGTPIFGAVFGVLASLCCAGPLVALTLGLGSVPFLVGLSRYRPYFIALSFVLMAGALWWTWKRNSSCCVTSEQKKRLYMTMTSITGAYLIVFLSLTYALPLLTNQYQAINNTKTTSKNMIVANKRVDLEIGGMTCSGCVTTVGSMLNEMKGVKEAKINFYDGTAVILINDAVFNKKEMITALNSFGYEGKIVSETQLN